MPILRDFPFVFDPEAALAHLGRDPSTLRARPQARRLYEAALTEARELLRPAIAYALWPVLRAEPGRLIVADGQALESPVVASLFGGAPEVVLMVYTIGPLLEEAVAQHHQAGDYPASYALDGLGSLAVNEVGRIGYGHIEEIAVGRGVRASIPLNPGTSHWPISGQRVIVDLVPAAEIGVEALPSGLLRPFKSISFAVALGSDVITPEMGSSCDYCETRDLCRR